MNVASSLAPLPSAVTAAAGSLIVSVSPAGLGRADRDAQAASLTGSVFSWLTNVDITHVGSPAGSMFG